MTIKQIFKSKTIDFNALVLAIFAILKAVDIEIPADLAAEIVAIVNIILRWITKKPLGEK